MPTSCCRPRPSEQWLRELTKSAVDDFEAFRENGVARFAPPKDAVAFAAQIRDPDTHKFTTPSGKIEIYSMAMAAKPDPYGLGAMPPISTWFALIMRAMDGRRRGQLPEGHIVHRLPAVLSLAGRARPRDAVGNVRREVGALLHYCVVRVKGALSPG
jgi:hypothetical protein